MDEGMIQEFLTRKLNEWVEDPWAAYKATSRDGLEYIEFGNELTGERYVISIQKGM